MESLTDAEKERPKNLTYYELAGKGVEGIVRCDGCNRLIVVAKLSGKAGCPKCGNRRFKEVRTLTLWEQIRLRTGWIDFPDKDKFLKEFGRG